MSDNITVTVDIKEVQAMFARLAEIGTVKTSEIKSVVRKAAAPIRSAAKSVAPVNKKNVNTIHATIRQHYGGGKFTLKAQMHAPGNLRRSISVWFSKKNKNSLIAYVGAAIGKSKAYSAPYSKFIILGFKTRRGAGKSMSKLGAKARVLPNPFMNRAETMAWDQSISILSTGLWNIIKRESEK